MSNCNLFSRDHNSQDPRFRNLTLDISLINIPLTERRRKQTEKVEKKNKNRHKCHSSEKKKLNEKLVAFP